MKVVERRMGSTIPCAASARPHRPNQVASGVDHALSRREEPTPFAHRGAGSVTDYQRVLAAQPSQGARVESVGLLATAGHGYGPRPPRVDDYDFVPELLDRFRHPVARCARLENDAHRRLF